MHLLWKYLGAHVCLFCLVWLPVVLLKQTVYSNELSLACSCYNTMYFFDCHDNDWMNTFSGACSGHYNGTPRYVYSRNVIQHGWFTKGELLPCLSKTFGEARKYWPDHASGANGGHHEEAIANETTRLPNGCLPQMKQVCKKGETRMKEPCRKCILKFCRIHFPWLIYGTHRCPKILVCYKTNLFTSESAGTYSPTLLCTL